MDQSDKKVELVVSNSNLSEHDNLVSDEKKHVCDIFQEAFTLESSMIIHRDMIHNEQKDYACDKCEKNFRQKYKLIRHQKVVHKGRKDYECDKCEKKFGQKSYLLVHQRTVHEGRKDYACDKCEKKFGDQSNLINHRKIVHEDRKNYTCDKCQKKFGRKSSLFIHQKSIHEGRKDYACDKCQKKFGQRGTLITHQKAVHEGRKDYACCKCEKKFKYKGQLNRHQKSVHEGRKDYACCKCEKKFKYKGQLNRHQKSVHEGRKDYALAVHENHQHDVNKKCENKSETPSNLSRHQKPIVSDKTDRDIYQSCTRKECCSQKLNSVDLPEKIFGGFEDEARKSFENKSENPNFNINKRILIPNKIDEDIYLSDTCNEWILQVLNSADFSKIVPESLKDKGNSKTEFEIPLNSNGKQKAVSLDEAEMGADKLSEKSDECFRRMTNSIDLKETCSDSCEDEACKKSGNGPENISNSNGNQNTAIADETHQEIYLPDTCEEWVTQVLNSIDHSETIFETFKHDGNSKNVPEILSNSNGNQITAIADKMDQEIYPQDTCEEWITQVLNSIDHSETIFETFKHDGNSKIDPEILSNSNGNQNPAIADEMHQEIYLPDTCEEWISQVLNSIDYPETIFETFERERISKTDPEILSNSNGNQKTETADEVDHEIYLPDTCEEWISQVLNSIDYPETIFETFEREGISKNDPEILSNSNGNQKTEIAGEVDQEIYPQDTCEEWVTQVLNSIDNPETIFETFEHEGISKNESGILSNSNGNQKTAILDQMYQEVYLSDSCKEWITQVLNSNDLPEKMSEGFKDEVRENWEKESESLSNCSKNQYSAIEEKMHQEIYLQDTREEWNLQVLNSIDHSETIFETFDHERNSETESESLSNFNEYQILAIAEEMDQEIYPPDTCVEWNSEVLNFIDLLEKIFETFEDEVRKNCVNKFDTSSNRP